jgi:hypothetical protein
MAAQIEREALTGVSGVEQPSFQNRDADLCSRQLRDSGWLPIDRKSPPLTKAYDSRLPQKNRATDNLDAPVGHATSLRSLFVAERQELGLADQRPATRPH